MKPYKIKKERAIRNKGEFATAHYKAIRKMLRNKGRSPTLQAILMT